VHVIMLQLYYSQK